MKPSILTASGGEFHYANPEQSTWTVEDIAHGLAHICRFAGHTTAFYSVAQHSVLMSQVVATELAWTALFHDAAEAFLGDVPTPLKALLPDYRALEKRVEQAIFARLGLPSTLPFAIKHADRVLLATERRDLTNYHGRVGSWADEWSPLRGIKPLELHIEPMAPAAARAAFLERVDELSMALQVGAG